MIDRKVHIPRLPVYEHFPLLAVWCRKIEIQRIFRCDIDIIYDISLITRLLEMAFSRLLGTVKRYQIVGIGKYRLPGPARCYPVLLLKCISRGKVNILKTFRCDICHRQRVLIYVCVILPFVWDTLIRLFRGIKPRDIILYPEQVIDKRCASSVVVRKIYRLAESEVRQPVKYLILLT